MDFQPVPLSGLIKENALALEYFDMTPSPISLIESLRDIGYSMKTAIADVVDNSITAGASWIHINFSWDNDYPWIAIADNGTGMTPEELIKAMRLGSRSPLEARSTDDLGRFGLGLKTASFSQCRRLTVVCRHSGTVTGMEWDLDSIVRDTDFGWKLPVMNEEDLKQDCLLMEIIEEQLTDSRGTLVLWRKLDRIDASRDQTVLESKLNSLIAEIRSHIEITFHRYLESRKPNEKIVICINGDRLEAHNPFNPDAPATQELPEQRIHLDGQHIIVKPYILPHFSKTSKTEYEKYRGEGSYLLNQGFYVYRNKRLIIKGTWFRLIPKAELTKLIRVRVDIPNSLDHIWKIDVKKSMAVPPVEVRRKLKEVIGKIAERGKIVYKRRGRVLLEEARIPTWQRSVVKGKIRYSINEDYPLLAQLREKLSGKDKKLLEIYINTLECGFPGDIYFDDFASAPEKMERIILSEEKLDRILEVFLESHRESGMSIEDSIRLIVSSEPFSSQPQMARELLARRKLIDD